MANSMQIKPSRTLWFHTVQLSASACYFSGLERGLCCCLLKSSSSMHFPISRMDERPFQQYNYMILLFLQYMQTEA